MVTIRIPAFSRSLYQTTGVSVAAPVKTPFTMKKGTNAMRKESGKYFSLLR